MKFPHTIHFRSLSATIYGKSDSYPFYRVAFRVAGKRVVRSFQTFPEAKKEAEAKLRQMATGDVAAALSPKESADALAIRQALAAFHRDTGRTLSALQAATGYLVALRSLPRDVSPEEACRQYARTLGTVKPKAIKEAVAEFIQSRQTKEAKPGERARFSPVYARNVAAWLTDFSATFPGHLVSEVCADFIERHLAKFSNLSAKARNDRRGALGMWLRWCGRKEFIEAQQLAKLLASDPMRTELLPEAQIEFYTPAELRRILDASEGALRVVTGLEAFGGARLQEALRLRWEDLHRTPGHIEIRGEHAKTRKRRLLEVGPALAQWLAPFQGRTGAIWEGPLNSFITEWARLRDSVGVPSKRNGVRHGFESFSYILRGEIETSALAGTSPTILHSNYRGLATKSEAEQWFAVMPTPPPVKSDEAAAGLPAK